MLAESYFKIIIIECTFFILICSKVIVPMYNLKEPCTKRCSSLRAHESEELPPRCIDPWAKRDGTPAVIMCFHGNILKDQGTPSNRRRGFTYGLLPSSRVIYSNILLKELDNGINIRVSTICLFFHALPVNKLTKVTQYWNRLITQQVVIEDGFVTILLVLSAIFRLAWILETYFLLFCGDRRKNIPRC